MQILLMHNDPAVRARVVGVLGAHFEALHCLEIGSVAELEHALELGDFEAVLTGDHLGWAAGQERLRLVKTKCPDRPVLMLTDVNDASYAVEALHIGFDDCVPMIDLPRLPGALLAALEQARERRQRAAEREQLRATADHYRVAAELASDFAYALHVPAPGQPPRLEWVSGTFTRITGYSLMDVLNTGWTHFVHPQDLGRAQQHAQRLAAGEPDVVEYRLLKAGGGVCWLREVARPAWDAGGKWIEYVYGAVQDVSERKEAEAEREAALARLSSQDAVLRDTLAELEKARAELETRVQERTAELSQREGSLRETMGRLARRETELQEALRLGAALNDIHRAINSTLDFAEIMQRVMVASTRALECDSAGVMQPQGPGWAIGYVHGLPPSAVGRTYPADQLPHALSAIETGDVVAVEDMLNDQPGPPRANVEAYNVRSSMAVPLLRRGEAIGVIFFNYHGRQVSFSRAQIDFGRKLAAAISLALENARLYAELEQRVRERTAALAQAVEQGRTQAARLQEQANLLNLSHDAIIARDMQAHVRFWNRAAAERYGWSAAEAMGQRSHDLFHTKFPTSEAEVYAALLANDYWEGELVHTRRDGQQIVVAARWSLQRDAQGQPTGVLEISNDITLRKEAELAVRRQSQRLQVLHEIDAAILAAQSAKQIARAAVRRVRQLIVCRTASVVLFDFERGEAERLALDVEGQTDGRDAREGQRFPLAGYAITEEHQRGVLTWLEDAQASEAEVLPAWVAQDAPRALLIIPLLAQGQLIGDLILGAKRPGAFAADDLPVARQVGDSLAVAIQNARLYEREQRARRVAEALRSANLALTRSLDIEQVLAVLLQSLGQLVPYDEAQIILVEEEEGCLTVRASRSARIGGGGDDRFMPQVYDSRTAPALAEVIDHQRSLLIGDTTTFEGWSQMHGFEGVGSWLGVPLLAGGKTIGLVSISRVEPAGLNGEHVHLAEGLAAQAAIAIQNAQLFRQVDTGLRQQQALARRLVEVQETERRSIARELHDEAGQALTSLMVNLNLLQRDADQREAVVRRAEEMKHVTGSVMDGLHRLSANLRPASLDHLGLVSALRQLAADYQRNGLQVDFMAVGFDDAAPQAKLEAVQRVSAELPGAGGRAAAGRASLPSTGEPAVSRLPAETETMLFRIIQEALTNVARHAQAGNVGILLERHVDRVTAVVEDDGVGFDREEAERRRRLGLLGMGERATMLGGKLTIESSPGKGTTVFVDIPLASD